MKSFEVNVNADIIKWSLKTINMPEYVLISKMKINRDKFEKWLNNTDKLTYIQLQKLSKIVNVSPLIFLSDKIPEDKPMNVFRTYIGTMEKSYKTLLKIKHINFLQNIASDLYDNLNMDKEPEIERYDANSNPQEVAIDERRKFFDFDDQLHSKNRYDALNKFKNKVEACNIIVMQLPFDDIRGFSVINKKPFFIVLNSRDTPESRIFSLFHEYAHILLGQNESNMDDNYNTDDKIEQWCNNFASYFLINDNIIKLNYEKYSSIDETVNHIASRYKLSHSMIFYRLYKLGYIRDFQSVYKKFMGNKIVANKKVSGGNYIVKIRSEYGNKFINLINENYEKNEITLDDALTYLGTKINTYNQLVKTVNQ